MEHSAESIVTGIASVTTGIHSVAAIARNLSLSSKNAGVLTTRIGESANGFRPIAMHIDDFATDVLEATGRMVRESAILTGIAARHLIGTDRTSRFRKVMNDASETAHINGFVEVARAHRVCCLDRRLEMATLLGRLATSFDHLTSTLRAAGNVATLCRIEANTAIGFRYGLAGIAEELEQCTEAIRSHIRRGRDVIIHMKARAIDTISGSS